MAYLNLSPRFAIIAILIMLGIIETFILSLRFRSYVKVKYPKTYKESDLDFFDGNRFGLVKELIINSHPKDKEYSKYIRMLRIGYILYIVMIIAIYFLNSINIYNL
jgi:hypothetical protein